MENLFSFLAFIVFFLSMAEVGLFLVMFIFADRWPELFGIIVMWSGIILILYAIITGIWTGSPDSPFLQLEDQLQKIAGHHVVSGSSYGRYDGIPNILRCSIFYGGILFGLILGMNIKDKNYVKKEKPSDHSDHAEPAGHH